MKKILLIGSEGSIGKRYKAILTYFGRTVLEFDENSPKEILDEPCDGIIIASPTITHFEYMLKLKYKDVPILCEKPMCATIQEAETIDHEMYTQVFVVDNWVHMIGNDKFNNCLEYNNYHTGNEKLSWNLAQPILLTRNGSLKLNLDAPFFSVFDFISSNGYAANHVDLSYVRMLHKWLVSSYTHFGTNDGRFMQRAIEEWEQKQ